ncbi:MAG: cytochrome bc complex cytochrome b subunit [Candidatus Thermoplasmatota archaeon]|jgi:quinol-cytochrome oxidoreductase complex cytochrome b subunit|nr:cytochrome bc complex cytochrome b subunit [Candidatus Thermoplasmatota archaeon]
MVTETENQDSFITRTFGDDPLKISELPLKVQPDYVRKKGGIWYWTGALISIAFIYQVVSGLLLLIYYNPGNPYVSTENIINSVPYGALMSATHLYGAYAMIVLIYVHMFRNYFKGAYKKPRQIQWILGVLLLAVTMGVGYYGYSLPGDVLAYDATDVGRGIAQSIPLFGNYLVSMGFGDGTTTGLFVRALGLHIILAAVLGGLFGLHFFLAEANNMMPSNREAKYRAPAMLKDDPSYKPWYPFNFVYMIQLGMFTLGFLILVPSIIALLPNVPALFSPFPGPPPSSPLALYVPPYPPWFLLPIYKAVDFFDFTGSFARLNLYGPLLATYFFAIIPLLYFLGLPFIDAKDDLHPISKPLITSFGILSIIYLVILSAWGALTPGVPIPFSEVAVVLGVPFVIVVAGMYGLNRLHRIGRLKISIDRVIGSFFVFLAILVIGVILLSENVSAFMGNSSMLNLVSTIFTGSVAVFGAAGTMKSANIVSNSQSSGIPRQRKYFTMRTGSANVLGLILVIIVVAITYLMFSLNPVSQSMEFGVGLGVDLIIGGILVRIYRLVAYNE